MKVFVVDDEYLQRELVKKTINWEKLEMELAGEAEDGEEALEKVLKEKPDILIMDINIPYMNGIEVSKRVKEALPNTQVIILTAYGEFEYAKQAVALGAVSFVLKPVNPAELTEELEKCKNKLEKIWNQEKSMKKMEETISQKQKEQFLLEQLSGLVPPEAEETIWRKLGKEPVKFLALLFLKFCDKSRAEDEEREIEDMIQDYFPAYECLEMNRDYLFLLYGDEQMEYQMQLMCTYLQEIMNRKNQFWGGASKVHHHAAELREAYQEAHSAAQRGGIYRKICIFEPVDMVAVLHTAAYEPEKLQMLLRKREYEAYFQTVAFYFERLEQEHVPSQAAGYIAMDILVHFSLYMADMGIDFSAKTEAEQRMLSAILDHERTGEIAENLLTLLKHGRVLLDHHKLPATKRKVQDAREFIDQNFDCFDLSLNLVAEEIGVNASYLSNIFKKECGCSLSKYITSVRLEQARKWMMEFPQRTLIEIAEAVGYSDVYYFSKNFKNYYGITPSKYQEKKR